MFIIFGVNELKAAYILIKYSSEKSYSHDRISNRNHMLQP